MAATAKSAKSYPVPPDSVYVWRGFKAPGKTYEQFAQFLGSIFVPACALLQPPVGLRAYLPTMVPQEKKPAALPDQTALMFWATPAAHDLANKAIAVRIYQNLHGDAYDLVKSHTPEVPVSIASVGGAGRPASNETRNATRTASAASPSAAASSAVTSSAAAAAGGSLVAEQPYFLIDQPADWMLGTTHHLVGARRADLKPADFLAQAYAWAAAFHAKPPAGVDGALVVCGTDYAAAWVHSAQRKPKLGAALKGLAALVVPQLSAMPKPLRIAAGLWNDWSGLDLTKDACINIQFARPPAGRTTPVKVGSGRAVAKTTASGRMVSKRIGAGGAVPKKLVSGRAVPKTDASGRGGR